jgi:hypothetical protein
MKIEETIGTLKEIYRSIDQGLPQTITMPDALVDYLNDLYLRLCKTSEFDELFTYDDVGGPSITVTICIEEDFNPKNIIKGMRTRLNALQSDHTDEMGSAGIVWSQGRYDFVYDENSEHLRISHQYSHKQIDTQSVLSIATKMIDYALSYLKEIKASA